MKFEYEKRKASRIKVAINGDINKYSKSFLSIYNNVKNDKDLLKMYNDYGDNIYVVCEKDVEKAAVQFLEQFGNVVSVEEVEVVQPICYDYKYNDDYDTEFLDIDEI